MDHTFASVAATDCSGLGKDLAAGGFDPTAIERRRCAAMLKQLGGSKVTNWLEAELVAAAVPGAQEFESTEERHLSASKVTSGSLPKFDFVETATVAIAISAVQDSLEVLV